MWGVVWRSVSDFMCLFLVIVRARGVRRPHQHRPALSLRWWANSWRSSWTRRTPSSRRSLSKNSRLSFWGLKVSVLLTSNVSLVSKSRSFKRFSGGNVSVSQSCSRPAAGRRSPRHHQRPDARPDAADAVRPRVRRPATARGEEVQRGQQRWFRKLRAYVKQLKFWRRHGWRVCKQRLIKFNSKCDTFLF